MLDVAELKTAGLYADFVQVNLSHNYKKGTLRGLHSQISTAAEDKLVSCIRGEIFDVCVDVRPDSATYGQYVGEVLSEKNGKMLYVPKGFAHGYLGLTDDSLTLYFVSQYYTPGSEKGYRYDDPFFGIEWPIKPPYIITDKDASWPLVRVQSQ
jgi:dTDP-4-dehydrorhamnose 3,5-epimerase